MRSEHVAETPVVSLTLASLSSTQKGDPQKDKSTAMNHALLQGLIRFMMDRQGSYNFLGPWVSFTC